MFLKYTVTKKIQCFLCIYSTTADFILRNFLLLGYNRQNLVEYLKPTLLVMLYNHRITQIITENSEIIITKNIFRDLYSFYFQFEFLLFSNTLSEKKHNLITVRI